MSKLGHFNYGQDIVIAFSPPVVGCLVKKGLQKGESWAPQDPPLATPLILKTHPRDTHVVAIKRMKGKRKRKQVIVGHVPLTLSRSLHLFFKHGGQISVQVTGKRRNQGIGHEIPATYTFCHKKESKILNLLKLKELLNDKEDKEAS